MKPALVGGLSAFTVAALILLLIDRYLRKPPIRYQLR